MVHVFASLGTGGGWATWKSTRTCELGTTEKKSPANGRKNFHRDNIAGKAIDSDIIIIQNLWNLYT